ncbi:YraN family protein [Silvanigrella aquatica]|uniref:Uncharacterized protein n=1 Tax=Silvanigrella aquatica TaxID=1915309 RepID=A0A1L4D3Q2_9BACT|nr:YraN family protein [Silvanigrella aquatica]APJ04802.1 hypothetical protein AXG55_13195 [Silvanigrella aquatica]
MDTAYKKKLGSWGEERVDLWMQQNNWHPKEKNLRIHKGEIDRVYFFKSGEGIKKYCIAEIKTNIIHSKKSFLELFNEVGIKKYLKQRQIQNIYKFGEMYLANGKKNIYLRIFIVLKFNQKLKIKNTIHKNSPIKICLIHHEYIILSIEPEFTNINSRKSLLQIKI